MSLASWNVLVVEDEADSMELVQGVLGYSGIHSVGATSGEDALRVLKEMPAPPTIIILDLALPGLNGWELMKTLKANKSLAHIPCIAITAFHTPELAEQAIEAGFNAYFAKPIDSMSFVRELQNIVGS
jgi:CheY-like chemotaxis protein